MVQNMRRKIRGKKRPGKDWGPSIAVRPTLKQPEYNAQRDLWGWACYYCGKEGHLKWDFPQASKLPLAPWLACKGPHWRRDSPLRHRPQESDSQGKWDWRCPGFPTEVPILITSEEPCVLITEGPISQFSFGHWDNFLFTKACDLISSLSTTVLGRAKHFYVSHPLSYNWDSVLCSRVSNHARVSLTPSGEGYTEQDPSLCFHDYGASSF